ncbi:pre-tRNA nuclear export protein [Blyttiomyces sp. JEL0837]|nr:pre-tRNA nuclear export protein [Blyttiomyces sp. JEL0837]
MENLERAILIALDPSADPRLKAEATAYFDQVRNDPNGWQACLSLFLAKPLRPAEARFIALQVPEQLLRDPARYNSIDPSQRNSIRQSLWSWLQNEVTESDPLFLRNKYCQVLVLLFRLEFTTNWRTFFDELLSLVTSSASGPRKDVIVYMFLKICMTIDEEVVSRDIPRLADELKLNAEIKDRMREDAVVKLCDMWFRLLMSDVAAGGVEVSNACLQIIGVYISWIDIKLVVIPDFISTLYGLLQDPTRRMSAVQCLTGIVEKGMSPQDKLDLIEGLNVISVMESIVTLDDEDFFEQTAKFFNLIGIDLCRCYEELPVNVRALPLYHLSKILPDAIKVLEHEDDDVCSIMFPFLDEFLKLLKELKKTNVVGSPVSAQLPGDKQLSVEQIAAFVDESLKAVLVAVVTKMKFDMEQPYIFGPGAGEDEALFDTLRKTLKQKMEIIITIDKAMYFSYFVSFISSIFDPMIVATSNGQSITKTVKWPDAELALHLLYISKDAPVYTMPDGSPAPLATLLSKMIQCKVSSYPHPSIALMYFEVVVRYAGFFICNPDSLSEILESFIDTRGIHNPNAHVRCRVYYQFLRFLKEFKEHRVRLRPFCSKMVVAIQDVLVVTPPTPPQLAALLTTQTSQSDLTSDLTASMFDSQLYLFEAVGFLISIEEPVGTKQEELLKVRKEFRYDMCDYGPLLNNTSSFRKQKKLVITPLMAAVQNVMETGFIDTSNTPENLVKVMHLKQLIIAMGNVSKGFPDHDGSSKTNAPSPLWATVFKQALHQIILVLERLNSFDVIREAARGAFQRMVGCIGGDILPFFKPLITAGLLNSATMRELSSFISSLGQLLNRFKLMVFPILDEIIMPLVEQTFFFLNQTFTGHDERNDVLDLKRTYFNFLNNVFMYELEGVFVSEANSAHLNTILQSCLHYAADPSDAITQKVVISLLAKMVASWGSASKSALLPAYSESNSNLASSSVQPLANRKSGMVGVKDGVNGAGTGAQPKKAKEPIMVGIGGKNTLPGFDKFIYESIVRVSFEIPMKPGFDAADAQTQNIFVELAALHKKILEVQGLEYVEYLTMYLPSINCPEASSQQFLMGLQTLAPRAFVKVVKETFVR